MTYGEIYRDILGLTVMVLTNDGLGYSIECLLLDNGDRVRLEQPGDLILRSPWWFRLAALVD